MRALLLVSSVGQAIHAFGRSACCAGFCGAVLASIRATAVALGRACGHKQTERLAPLGLLGGTTLISILKSNNRTA